MAFNQGRDLNVEQGEQDVSKINAAGLINLRVQDAWSACARYFKDGAYDELRDALASLWPEFYADASLDQKKELTKIDGEISSHMQVRNAAFRAGKKKEMIKFNMRYKYAIYQKWLFLKTLEKAQGIGRAYIDPGADDWE